MSGPVTKMKTGSSRSQHGNSSKSGSTIPYIVARTRWYHLNKNHIVKKLQTREGKFGRFCEVLWMTIMVTSPTSITLLQPDHQLIGNKFCTGSPYEKVQQNREKWKTSPQSQARKLLCHVTDYKPVLYRRPNRTNSICRYYFMNVYLASSSMKISDLVGSQKEQLIIQLHFLIQHPII